MTSTSEFIIVMFSFVSGALAWAVICAILRIRALFKQKDEA